MKSTAMYLTTIRQPCSNTKTCWQSLLLVTTNFLPNIPAQFPHHQCKKNCVSYPIMICTSIQFDLVQHYYGYYGGLITWMFLGFLWIFWSPLDLVTLTSEKAFCKDLVLGFVWHVYSGVPWFFFNFCEFFEVCHICVTHHAVTCHSKLIPPKNAVKWCPYCLSCTNKHKQTQIFNTLFFLDFFCNLSDFYQNPIRMPDSYRILVKLGGDCKVLKSRVLLILSNFHIQTKNSDSNHTVEDSSSKVPE